MAPRQKRRVEVDENRFVNVRAQARYNSVVKAKKCIQDRVFEQPGGRIEMTIQERHWDNFCYNSNRAAVEVVKEFYANLTQCEDAPVKIRGIFVEFSAARINAYYEVADPYTNEYDTFGTMEGPLEEVIDFLTDGKGVWKLKQRERVNFPLSMMNATSKAWHYFICSTLLPTYHHSEVSRDRAVLNYCIQNNKSINVGNIIFKNIIAIAKSESGGGLGHPGLIYALCQLSGVEARDDEEWVYPAKPITKLNIKTYESHEGWRSGSRSAAPSTSRDIPSTSYDPPAASSPTLHDIMNELTLQRRSFEERFDRIDQRLGGLDQRMGGLEQRYEYDSQYLQRHSDFEASYFDAESRYRSGELGTIFPEYPRYTPYQPQPPPDPGNNDDIVWDFDV